MGLVINLFKGLTPFVLFGLMFSFSCFNLTSKVLLATHGSYGLLWLLKESLFPDPSWNTKTTLIGSCFIAATLILYWSPAYIITSRHYNAPESVIALAVAIYAFGIVLMMGSDSQKNVTLKIKKGLITTGFFQICRNPNYLVKREKAPKTIKS